MTAPQVVEPFPEKEPPALRQVTMQRASEITPRRTKWLWHERMAMGRLHLLAGPEGHGKSTFLYWLAARITRGELPGELAGQPRDVVVVATEDSWAETIVPRLIVAGADLDRIRPVEVRRPDGTDAPLILSADTKGLLEGARSVGAAAIIFDPLMSGMGGADIYKESEVREVLEPLVKGCERDGCAVLGIIHFNKRGQVGANPLDKITASKAFTSLARGVSVVMRDPDDDTGARRLFGTPKNNLGRDDLPMLSFTICGQHVDTEDGPAETSGLTWGEDVEGSISEVMGRLVDAGDKTAVGEALDWLEDYLSQQGGEAPYADVKKNGQAAGHSLDALKRARKKGNITARSFGFPRQTAWVLQVASRGESDWSALTKLTAPAEGPVSAVSAVGAGFRTPPTDGFLEVAELLS